MKLKMLNGSATEFFAIMLLVIVSLGAQKAHADGLEIEDNGGRAVAEDVLPQWTYHHRGVRLAGWTMLAGVRACAGDIVELCDDVVPGGGRLVQCLMDQQNIISFRCRAAINRLMDSRDALAACNAAAARLCPNVSPGGGRIYDCLSRQRSHLPQLCRQALRDVEGRYGR